MCGPRFAAWSAVPRSPRLAYAATTSICTFFLDEEGFCRKVDLAPRVEGRVARAAEGCVGAQYLAALDAATPGSLADQPRVGSSMLFAKMDGGRAALVRTGVVTRFLRLSVDARNDVDVLDPFVHTDEVRTSAPPVLPSPIRLDATGDLPVAPLDPAELTELAELDASEDAVTVHIPRSGRRVVEREIPDDDDLAKTAEYRRAQ